MTKAGKVWGTTELIEANGALEFHRIEMKAGGVCSKHLHRYKWNGFYVESGKMLVRVWQRDYDLVDETIIGPNEYTRVKPGLYHQFECLESGVAYELYWAEFNHNDIIRDTVGEMKSDEDSDCLATFGETIDLPPIDENEYSGDSTYETRAFEAATAARKAFQGDKTSIFEAVGDEWPGEDSGVENFSPPGPGWV